MGRLMAWGYGAEREISKIISNFKTESYVIAEYGLCDGFSWNWN